MSDSGARLRLFSIPRRTLEPTRLQAKYWFAQCRQAKEQIMSNKKGSPNFRDAGTGKFVTEKYAKAHPKTIEKEYDRQPPAPTEGGRSSGRALAHAGLLSMFATARPKDEHLRQAINGIDRNRGSHDE
jgi:hypothetical protein